MKIGMLLMVAFVTLAAGCASKPRANARDIDWSSRIGSYTYEEALAELGRPDVIGESSGGKTAEWVIRRSPNVTFGFGVGGGSFGHHSGAGVGVGTSVSPPPRGEYLRLQFDQAGKLVEWTKVRY